MKSPLRGKKGKNGNFINNNKTLFLVFVAIWRNRNNIFQARTCAYKLLNRNPNSLNSFLTVGWKRFFLCTEYREWNFLKTFIWQENKRRTKVWQKLENKKWKIFLFGFFLFFFSHFLQFLVFQKKLQEKWEKWSDILKKKILPFPPSSLRLYHRIFGYHWKLMNNQGVFIAHISS